MQILHTPPFFWCVPFLLNGETRSGRLAPPLFWQNQLRRPSFSARREREIQKCTIRHSKRRGGGRYGIRQLKDFFYYSRKSNAYVNVATGIASVHIIMASCLISYPSKRTQTCMERDSRGNYGWGEAEMDAAQFFLHVENRILLPPLQFPRRKVTCAPLFLFFRKK